LLVVVVIGVGVGVGGGGVGPVLALLGERFVGERARGCVGSWPACWRRERGGGSGGWRYEILN